MEAKELGHSFYTSGWREFYKNRKGSAYSEPVCCVKYNYFSHSSLCTSINRQDLFLAETPLKWFPNCPFYSAPQYCLVIRAQGRGAPFHLYAGSTLFGLGVVCPWFRRNENREEARPQVCRPPGSALWFRGSQCGKGTPTRILWVLLVCVSLGHPEMCGVVARSRPCNR